MTTFPKTRRTAPETKLVTACLKLLNVRQIPAWRNNTGRANIGGRRVRFGIKGSSDIFGILRPSGRFLAVECKVGRNKPTLEQAAFLEMINDNGGVGVVVYDVDELDEIVTRTG